jgi:hypothetical protein
MVDSENVGKNEIQERNRTVVHLPCEFRRALCLEFLARQSRVEFPLESRIVSILLTTQLTTLLSPGNTPGMAYRALANFRIRGGGGGDLGLFKMNTYRRTC